MAYIAAFISLIIGLLIPGIVLGWLIAVAVRKKERGRFNELARSSTDKDLKV